MKETYLNPYRAIQGTLPRKREMAEWDTKKYMFFLNFCLTYMQEEDGEMKIKLTQERWKQDMDFLKMPNHPYHEFLYRINQFSTDPESTPRKFFYKFASFMRIVLGYLKMNPAIISPEMREIIEPNARMKWCLNNTKVIETKIGAEVVVPDTLDNVSYSKKMVQAPNADKMLLDAMVQVGNVYKLIADSISKKEIEKMNVKDKIAALNRLSFIFTATRNFKPNGNVFAKINVYNADKNDLEKALLDFTKVTNEEE